MIGYHKSVLVKEVLDALNVQKGKWYLDGTLGDGGHSLEILKRGGKVVGIDQDPDALVRTKTRFDQEGIDHESYRLIEGNFSKVTDLVDQTKFGGIILDLGVSSFQLETPQRGFSFQADANLDMRMSPKLAVRAQDLINGLNKGELYELFTKYGEEWDAGRIAQAVVSARQVNQISTTGQLAEIIQKIAGGRKRVKIHPATKVFQALRIAVNDELEVLKLGLPQALELLNTDGHLAVISFHSLEDRIVKKLFLDWQEGRLGEIITKKPIGPSEAEVETNARSRSAKLRVFEKNK